MFLTITLCTLDQICSSNFFTPSFWEVVMYPSKSLCLDFHEKPVKIGSYKSFDKFRIICKYFWNPDNVWSLALKRLEKITFFESQCVLQKLEPSGLCRSLVVDEDRQTMHVGTSDGRIVTFHYSREKRELQHFQDEAVDNEPLLELSYGKHLIIGRGLQSLHPITCDHDGKQRGTVTSGIADYESSHEWIIYKPAFQENVCKSNVVTSSLMCYKSMFFVPYLFCIIFLAIHWRWFW